MIAFLAICYAGLVWLVFFKLKVLKWNAITQGVVYGAGIVGVFLLVVLMNLYQPQAIEGVSSRPVIPIIARVTGRIIEVPVERNSNVKAGDVLFRIDPGPYQAEVDRLTAALAEAEQAVPQLEAAWRETQAAVAQSKAELQLAQVDFDRLSEAFRQQAASQTEFDTATGRRDASLAAVDRAEAAERRAKLAYESEVGGVNTTVAQIRAQLASAEIDLQECTVYAPQDGVVTQLFVEPGAVTNTMPFASVMTFMPQETLFIRATFRPNALKHMKEGDAAEVVFGAIPGRVFEGKVHAIVKATGAGALTPSGDLLSTSQLQPGDLVFTAITLADGQLEHEPPVGSGCTVAVYTDGAKPIRIIRKVVMRMQAWIAYL